MAERRSRGRESRRAARNREYRIPEMPKEDLERINARRRKKKGGALIPLIAVLLIMILAGGLLGGVIAKRYAPSTERKDLNEWFEASGPEVRIYLNDTLDREVSGTAEGGTVYLPVTWVQTNLNKRFYWQPEDGQLIYTLPDEVVRYTPDSRDPNGNPVYRVFEDGEMGISLEVIGQYTDIRCDQFAGEEESAKRVFIYNDWSPYQLAYAKRDSQIRTRGGVKAPILADVQKGEPLKLLEEMDSWSRVVSGSGVIGYIQNRALGEAAEETPESSFEAPVFQHQQLEEKVVLGWHAVFGRAAALDSLDSVCENTKGVMNVICPTGIQIKNAEGEYVNFIDEEYVQRAHEKGLQVWVMVDNFNQPGGLSDFSTGEYFARAANRQSFIDRLMADAEAYGYDGYNLDFEGIPASAGPSYVQFYRELSVACRANGLVLSIDNYVPYQFNDYYDLGEQGDFADYVVIMGYDEHTTGSEEPGSVASIGYTAFGIEETMKEVSPEYVINGVPFFTRVWRQSGPNLSSNAMGIADAQAYVEQQGIELSWDEETGQYYGKKETETGITQIWMEEERSLAEKISLIRENGLGGVAGWRLGYEPAEIWKELDLNGTYAGDEAAGTPEAEGAEGASEDGEMAEDGNENTEA